MKIVANEKIIRLGDIATGEGFRLGKSTSVMVKTDEKARNGLRFCMHLACGTLVSFSEEEEVYPVEAVVHVS